MKQPSGSLLRYLSILFFYNLKTAFKLDMLMSYRDDDDGGGARKKKFEWRSTVSLGY